MSEEMKALRKEIVHKVLLLTVEIEYAEGHEKDLLLAKYEGFKEAWELTGGDIPEEVAS
ncbi:hypothetical protein [Bacillus sp. UNC438CL73TsuS30]|uniref:hypothetical protein n=1 Tax=Bacillus sp. UNC438CL73TsuS30 TaxID=1340434 RepID=UPI000AC0659E|nr:hypothetical protein [Bacillus sp. UNC438CL73TsuS30]